MVKPISTPPETVSVSDFEHSLDELEQLVACMEGGELSLDESLSAFERGIALYRHCQQALDQAQLRVRLLLDPEIPEQAEAFEAPGQQENT